VLLGTGSDHGMAAARMQHDQLISRMTGPPDQSSLTRIQYPSAGRGRGHLMAVWSRIALEMQDYDLDEGLRLRSLSLGKGQEDLAKAIYSKLRHHEIILEQKVVLA